MAKVWSLDIETIPGPTQSLQGLRKQDADRLLEQIEVDRTVAPADRKYIDKRLTDPAKIDAAIAAKIAQGSQLIQDRDALDPMTATPICIACVYMDKAIHPIDSSSGYAIKTFTSDQIPAFYDWARTEVDQFLGFNIEDFDLRVLQIQQAKTTTGQCNRVPALWNIPIDLYRELGDKWSKAKYGTPHTLRMYVATILDRESQHGGPVKEFLASTFTGEDVGRAYMEGRKHDITRHCTLDALMIALIAVKMRIYR